MGHHRVFIRFLATEESFAHPAYKRNLIELSDVEYTDMFGRARWPGAAHRVLRTLFFKDSKLIADHENEVNQPVIGHSAIHGIVSIIHNFSNLIPN